jgi:hypothetical protein
VLARIRKDYHFFSYFRGDELRMRLTCVPRSGSVTQNFSFQQNIIEDELEYKRKDDILLSATAYSCESVSNHFTYQRRHKKTKTERLTVWVSFRNGQADLSEVKKESGEKKEFPIAERGESRTLYFWNVTDGYELVKLASDELAKYYYTGLSGKFTTFGLPFVRQGDNAKIVDSVLTERSGTYKIKSVDYKGGVSGLRQIINLDYKIS